MRVLMVSLWMVLVAVVAQAQSPLLGGPVTGKLVRTLESCEVRGEVWNNSIVQVGYCDGERFFAYSCKNEGLIANNGIPGAWCDGVRLHALHPSETGWDIGPDESRAAYAVAIAIVRELDGKQPHATEAEKASRVQDILLRRMGQIVTSGASK